MKHDTITVTCILFNPAKKTKAMSEGKPHRFKTSDENEDDDGTDEPVIKEVEKYQEEEVVTPIVEPYRDLEFETVTPTEANERKGMQVVSILT